VLVEELRAVRIVGPANPLAQRQQNPVNATDVAVTHLVGEVLAGTAQRAGVTQALEDRNLCGGDVLLG